MNAPVITPSRLEMWLTARITGPVRGMCSRPSRRTLATDRAPIRATSAVIRTSIVWSLSSRYAASRTALDLGRAGLRRSAVIALELRPSSGARLGGRPVSPGRRGVSRSRRAARCGVDRSDHEVHRLAERVAVGADVDGIGGRSQWRDRTVAILVVACAQLLTDLAGVVAVGVKASLRDPAIRALVDRGVEEHLEVRVGEHDGADIPAGEHDPARRRDRP